MTRDRTPYADRAATRTFEGFDASVPIAGYYRMRMRSGGVRGGVRIWFGQPLDPVTLEPLDRSLRWNATFNGQPCDLERVWPDCAREPLSEADYNLLLRRHEWAQENAPGSAYANPRRKYDPLDPSNPLPF